MKQVTSKEKSIHGHAYEVVSTSESATKLNIRESEMDKRATHAVKVAVEKAKICNKPVARYDAVKKIPYLEYADGRKKYAE